MDDAALSDLLADLIRLESVNPDLVPGGVGEGRMGEFVGTWLADRGIEVSYQEVEPGRSNVIGRVRGHGGGRSLLLNAHLDTVGLATMPEALEPVVGDGLMYGRGAQDMKSGLAAAMAVAEEAIGMNLAGDLLLAAVIDEECASKGTEALLRNWRADAGIVLEPTGHVIAPVHKGFVWAEIETQGVAAHGSDPDAGVDAIAAMGYGLVELDRLGTELRRRLPATQAGTGSLHASLIDGGSEAATYPERCRLLVERRVVPGESAGTVLAELEAAVAAARSAAATPAGTARWSASVSIRLDRPPLVTPAGEPIVQAVERASSKVLGHAQMGAVAFWTDGALMSAAGIPTVVFGVRGGGLHSAREWVELSSVRAVASVLLEAARDFCSNSADA